jgi:hypothetical protein
MRFDGVNKSNKRTSIRLNSDHEELSRLVLGLFESQDNVTIRLRKIVKESLYNQLSSEELKKEVLKEIETLLILNNLIQFDELNKNEEV